MIFHFTANGLHPYDESSQFHLGLLCMTVLDLSSILRLKIMSYEQYLLLSSDYAFRYFIQIKFVVL